MIARPTAGDVFCGLAALRREIAAAERRAYQVEAAFASPELNTVARDRPAAGQAVGAVARVSAGGQA
jgi:hypothetical protein